MEPIDYSGALLRRWWWLVVFGLVGALAAFLVPAGHAKHGSAPTWKTTAYVGAVPAGGTNALYSSGFNINQVLFYAHNTGIAQAAASSVGLKIPVSQLPSRVDASRPATKSGTKGGVQGEVEIQTSANSAATSAAFTNAFVAQLGDYMSNVLAQRQQAQLTVDQQKVKAIEARIAAVGRAKGTAGLSAQLNTALAQEQELESYKPSTGYLVLQPALASSAVKSGGGASLTSSLTSNKGVRVLVGFVVGVLLAAGAILLLEAFDKRVRTSSRAAEAFGFPVVAEIPASQKDSSYDGFIDASGSSASPAAEAYRMLCTSLLLEGVSTDGPEASPYNRRVAAPGKGTGRTYGSGNRHASSNRHASGNRSGQSNDHSSGRGTGAVSASELLAGARPFAGGTRQVVLVVSAGDEPTRPMVVANIAATYAGSGQRVLVASTQDLHMPVRGVQGRRSSGDITAMDIEIEVQPSRFKNVSTLPLDQFVDNRVQLITRAPAIFDAARHSADVVIVEAPSILAFHDAEAVAPCVDVVLVVSDCYTTTSEGASRAGDLLRRIGAPVLGVVLTNVHLRAQDIRRLSARPAPVQSSAYLEPAAVTSSIQEPTVLPGGPTT